MKWLGILVLLFSVFWLGRLSAPKAESAPDSPAAETSQAAVTPRSTPSGVPTQRPSAVGEEAKETVSTTEATEKVKEETEFERPPTARQTPAENLNQDQEPEPAKIPLPKPKLADPLQGFGGRTPAPFNKNYAKQFAGRYEGRMQYADPSTKKTYGFKMTLDINNLDQRTNFLILVPNGKNETRKSFVNFKSQILGTDPDAGSLNLSWKNETRAHASFAEYLGFGIPADSLQTFTMIVYGLGGDSDWTEIGTVNLRKTR